MKVKHDMHQYGVCSERLFPMSRMTGAPGPSNGAPHIRHRGPCGMRPNTRRLARSKGDPLIRNSRQNSSLSGSPDLLAVTSDTSSCTRIVNDGTDGRWHRFLRTRTAVLFSV